MGLSEIIYMKQSGKIHPGASLFDILFTRKMGQESITTTTGNPVSIITNKAQNAISTILSYSPRQSGSGDPSPSNVRPIEGWTEANLGVNSETPTTTLSLGGTYYGFSVDVERGVLRVTHGVFIADGTEEVVNVNTYNGVYYVILTTSLGAKNAICISDKFKYKQAIEAGCTYIGVNGQSLVCSLLDQTITTKEAAKQWFLDNPTKWVYELATPLELPLTPQTVALLAGNNTIWTDGDSINITYRR